MTKAATTEYAYHIDRDNRLVYVDDHFRDFARDNDTPDLASDDILNRDIFNYISGVETCHLYDALFTAVRNGDTAMIVPFRCDSPSLKRFMELRLAPKDKGEIHLTGRLLRTEPQTPLTLLDPHAERGATMLVMCSFCKSAEIESEGWVATERAVQLLDLFGSMVMPRLSHGVCDRCLPEFERMCGLPS